MNKAQKEVQQAHLKNEKHVIELLKKVYEQASKDCDERIRELSARAVFENLQSVIYQKQYQEALKTQLSSIMDNLQTEQYTTIDGYLQNCYKNGYTGAMYDIAKQGVPVVMPIRQDQVVKAVQTNSKLSEGLYKRLGEDTKYLKRSVRAELSRGIANGSSWNDMAAHIASGMKSPYNRAYNRAVVIARTEGHRVQQESGLDACKAAQKKGADVVKQWDATLDGRTRPEHREADGQIRELDEDFDVGGQKLKAPGVGGSAWNVCNCRCCMLQRARWALDEEELQTLKDRAEYFGLDKTESFEEFKENYLKVKESDVEEYQRRRTGEQGQEIIDKATYSKLTKNFLKNGGTIVRGDAAARHLESQGAFASYMTGANIAFIRDDATVSDVLEEMYHALQDRENMFSDYPEDEILVRREIDAQKYLLSVIDKYKIPLEETEVTRGNLETYEKRLKRLQNKGLNR